MSSLQELLGALTPSRDRRLHARTTPASLTYVELRDANGGMVLNISEDGMALDVADTFAVGEHLSRIRFPLPISNQSFEVSAQIVWLSESKNGAGIRFVDLTPDARNQLSRWIESEKPALEFTQLLKPLRSRTQILEIGSRRSRTIFTDAPDRDEDATARYAEMFPSESTYTRHAATVDEIKQQEDPLPLPARTPVDAHVSMPGSDVQISTGEVPPDLTAIFPSEHAKDFPAESDGSFPREQIQSSPPEWIANNEPPALEIGASEVPNSSRLLLVEDLQDKTPDHAPIPELEPQVLARKIDSSPDLTAHSPLLFYVPEGLREKGLEERSAEIRFGFHLIAAVCLFAVVGIIVELAGGLGPLGRRFRQPEKPTPVADGTPPVLPDRTGGVTSQTPAPPATNTLDTSAAGLPAPHADVSHSETPSDPSQNARPAHSASRVSPPGPTSADTNRSNVDSENSSGADKIANKIADKTDAAPPSAEKSKEVARSSDPLSNLPSNNFNSSPAIQREPSTSPKSSSQPVGTDAPVARNAPPTANPEPEPSRPAMPVNPIPATPKNPAPRSATTTTRPAPFRSRPPAILITPPAEGGNPSKVIFQEKAISVSSSFAITSQLSVLVSPEPGPAADHQPARLQAGELLFYAEPHFPKPKNGRGSAETIKVRATIGQQGQVIDVKPVSGPPSLFPAAKKAIREWRYKPTLINGRPIQFQQDVTIEFQPPQRPSRR
jgi:periplasmic protein TonB